MGGHIAKKGNSYYAAVYEGVNTFGTWTDPGDVAGGFYSSTVIGRSIPAS